MGYNMPADEGLRGDVDLLSGSAPDAADEVAIDATSAEENHIAIGSTIKVLFQGPTQEFTVVGTVGFGGEKNLGGTTSAYFETETAQTVLGKAGFFDSIGVSAEDGVSQAELTKNLSAVVPEGTEAVTGKTVAQENSDAVQKDLKVVGILFMIFAGVALFVGAFIIWNTFTMIVTQRSREIALLRAIGATRRQVMRSLVLEAVLLGIGASAIGIGLGHGRRQGPDHPDGRGGVQPAEYVAAARAPDDRGLAARGHTGHRRRRTRAGPSRHQGAAGRGAARVDTRGGEAVEATCLHRPGTHRSRHGRDPVRPVRRTPT